MAYIIPSSDLRNKYNEISKFCHTYNEPVYITRNGASDLVLLSNAEYERLTAKQELIRLLQEGYEDAITGRTRPAEDVFAELDKLFEVEA